MNDSDAIAEQQLAEALASIDNYYASRGIFQERFGFGKRPAIVVVDFAYGWTDGAYAGGTKRLDGPVENTATLLAAARNRRSAEDGVSTQLASDIPIIYTTSPYRPTAPDQPFKSAADESMTFRAWDQRACEIDERVAPVSTDLVIEKENASAFFGTHLAPFLISQNVDTLLITGCSTSACIRATATDAKSYRFRPIIVRECVGDRAPAAHVFTLADIQARFADVVSLEETLEYVKLLSI